MKKLLDSERLRAVQFFLEFCAKMYNSMQLQLQKIQSDWPRNIAIQNNQWRAQESGVIWRAMHGWVVKNREARFNWHVKSSLRYNDGLTV